MPRCWAFALALLSALVAVSDPGAKGAPRRGRTTRAPAAKPAPSEPQKRVYRVAAIGDSLTAARSHGGKYLDYLRKKCPESRFDNYGKGGETVQQMRRRFAREVLGEPRRRGATKPAYSHVIVFGGVNDLMQDRSAGRSTEKIIEDLDAMYAQARRAGVRVIAITVSPWGGLSRFYNPRRAKSMHDVNAWLLSQARSGKLEVALDSGRVLGCDDGERLCARFEMPWIRDGLHFNEQAHAELGRALHESAFADCR